MDTKDDEYVCTLDEASIKKAKAELGENPDDRLSAVQALRTWITQQPHIRCASLDTMMLLKFLRGAKFSQIRAREMIEANMLLKKKAPQWFKDVDTHDKHILNLIKTGYIAPLPKRTPQGCQVILYRLGKLNPKTFEIKYLFRAATIILEHLSREESTQVNGVVFIMDLSDLSAALLNIMMSSDMQKWQKMWQKNTPGRFKGFNYYNTGLIFETILAFVKTFAPKKWIDRIKLHDTLETLYKEVPMECLPEEYLPDDYNGPNAGPIDECINTFIDKITTKEFRDHVLHVTGDAYTVDESKKPTETVTQHFRKLNVD